MWAGRSEAVYCMGWSVRPGVESDMKRSLLAISTILAMGALLLYGADFWEKKEVNDWSEKDIKKMMRNSPWAKGIDVPLDGGMGLGGGGGGPGMGGGGTSGGGMPGGGGGGMPGAGGGGGRGGSGFEPPPTRRIFMRWISALPVRQAYALARFQGELDSPEAQRLINIEDDRHILQVEGLNARTFGASCIEEAKQRIVLKVKGQEPVMPEDVQMEGGQRRQGARGGGGRGGGLMMFYFPNAANGGLQIGPQDKSVEVHMKLSFTTVRQRFQLKKMQYAGKLEL